MKVIYNGRDIYKDISLNYCVYESYAEKQSDVLVMRFNDPKGVFGQWNPQTGDEISFEHEDAKTGVMFIQSIRPENGTMTIRALSVPLSVKSKTTKSWESIGFLDLCKEVAGRHGLGFEQYEVTDHTYDYMAQDDEADIAWLSCLCACEGCQLIVYDKKLIVYDEKSTESKDTSGDLDIGIAGIFSYDDTRKFSYGRCDVFSGLISGSAQDEQGNPDKVFTPSMPLHVNTAEEASRWAEKLLRDVNKNSMCGSFCRSLKTGYAAGSVMNLKTAKADSWNGKVFLTRVRHDFVKNKTNFYFRKVFLTY